MPTDPPTPADLAISEMRREMAVGLTEIRGQLALLVQRAGQTDDRFQRVDEAVAQIDARVDTVERTQVTRGEIYDKRGRTLVLVSVVVAVVGVIANTMTTVLTIILGGN